MMRRSSIAALVFVVGVVMFFLGIAGLIGTLLVVLLGWMAPVLTVTGLIMIVVALVMRKFRL